MICRSGRCFTGSPISVEYSDESESGEDEINIETKSGCIVGLKESEIAYIKILEE